MLIFSSTTMDLTQPLVMLGLIAVIAFVDLTSALAQAAQTAPLVITALATALAMISLGGGFYEVTVVDPAWPRKPALVQPEHGGISRKRFWIPAHVAFELSLFVSLYLLWSAPGARFWLLVAFASHAVMRLWSAFDFIPKALAFERADPANVTESAARRWVSRSRLRLPLDFVTCGAMLAAFAAAARL
ncbi:hypothetical protein GJW-30_1_01326 [Variibacter gotjawalensis]|uniref:DUF1772 domain-containing protein n=1 Tax=Variibacter gotjawalensis TaxID=1333996 RepID=A0A0S3PS85_9BRAD|nr:hypothetical protein [Variibacter gotjawalensis]NIK49109.1 hypothetical protein [Variibacter gotjawalensis]RZS50965.1 hypothetical protein EV661_3437 [Variibacter gotjawalensis]BAT58799.1 hypothetical protein GJW-30_1_01326 [Variibacter gotjawalensis]